MPSTAQDPYPPGGGGGGDRGRPAPAACGAIGDYDRERVLKAAASLQGGMRIVHEDDDSILLLDREPIAWNGRGERGFGWVQGDLWRGPAASWEAAARGGACGLVVGGRRPFVHSAVSGLAPIYRIDGPGATYFASRIDPLAAAAPGLLSIDWDAWASIIALRYPTGERTPFAEISRLDPHATFQRRLGRSRVRAPSWPWAEVEPRLDPEAGAGAAAEALRESLACLAGETLCPLSGGLDSRIICAALPASARAAGVALTANDDEGGRYEEEIAAQVATTLGIRWEELRSPVEDYPGDWDQRARRVEYQFVDHAWLVPVARRVDGARAPLLDGWALDTFQMAGAGFITPAVIEAGPRNSNAVLFESSRQYGDSTLALSPALRGPIVERARSGFMARTGDFIGHPSQALLALFATRTLRGTGSYPNGLFGCGAQVIAPGSHDRIVTALLSVGPDGKRDGAMRRALQALIDPRLSAIGSTDEAVREAPVLPRRWRSDAAVDAYRALLADGPLTPHLSPELVSWLERPDRGELSTDLRLGLEGTSLLHAWWRRYRDRLRQVDAADLA